jgi:hypothetical protein
MRKVGRLALRARAEFSSFDANNQNNQSSFLRFGLSLDALWPLLWTDRFALLLGPTVGMPIVRQHDSRYDGTYSFGLSYGGAASAMLRSYRSTWLVLSAEAGGEAFRLDGQLVQRASAGISLGGLIAF